MLSNAPAFLRPTLNAVLKSHGTDRKVLPRPVKIRVYSSNQKGILAAITRVITKHESNILRASVYTTSEGQGINSFEVAVQDINHLNRVMAAIRKIKGVLQVERVRFGRKKSG